MGIFSAFWVLLHIPYQLGAPAQIPNTVNAFGLEPWRRLENWLINLWLPAYQKQFSSGLVCLGLLD